MSPAASTLQVQYLDVGRKRTLAGAPWQNGRRAPPRHRLIRRGAKRECGRPQDQSDPRSLMTPERAAKAGPMKMADESKGRAPAGLVI